MSDTFLLIYPATRVRPLLLTCLLALAGAAHGGEPASATDEGMLRMRDMTPFGLLRLDLRPPQEPPTSAGDWAVEFDLSYQNTFASSINSRNYLYARGIGRAPARPEDVEAILALPGDDYHVDGEFGRFSLLVHRRLNERWSASLELPYLTYGDSLLDRAVEQFHEALGLRQQGRDFVARDRFQVFYEIDGARQVHLEGTPAGGLGDPVIVVSHRPGRSWLGWQPTIELAAKLAVGGEREWLSTGHNDYGLQLGLRRSFGRQALHLASSLVYYAGGADLPVTRRSQVIPTLAVAWSRRMGERTRFIVQGYAGESVVDRTNIGGLAAEKYLLSIGLQRDNGRLAWTASITNNVSTFHNTLDVGAQLNFTYRPQGP